jgi:predicted Zn finger-like uncharacterized protein
MSLATRCPICHALFRVTPDQLRVRAGQVRCGRCSAVFDGIAHLVRESDRASLPTGDAMHEAADTPLPEIETLEPEAVADSEPAPIEAGPTDIPAPEPLAAPVVQAALPPVAPADESSQDWLRQEWRAVAASAFLAFLLVLQFGMRNRDVLAAEHPGFRGILSGLCSLFGCEVSPPRLVEQLSIEDDELIATDPKDPSRISLVATLRNAAAFPVAYPSLELSLQNADQDILARRVLGPADYLPVGNDAAGGLAGRGDVNVRLALDTGSIRPEGYRLFLFYPKARAD